MGAAIAGDIYSQTVCDGAVVKKKDVVGQGDGLGNIMGDQQNSQVSGVHGFEQQVLGCQSCQSIEGAEGFVEKHDWWVDGEGACDADSLLHAAGEAGGAPFGGVGEAYLFEVGAGDVGAFGFAQGGARGAEAEVDVAACGQSGQEGVVLENHASVRSWSFNFFVACADCAGGWGGQSGDHFENC